MRGFVMRYNLKLISDFRMLNIPGPAIREQLGGRAQQACQMSYALVLGHRRHRWLLSIHMLHCPKKMKFYIRLPWNHLIIEYIVP